MIRFTKQPSENIDHLIDMSAWTPADDSVVSVTATAVPQGLTIFVSGSTTLKPKVWLGKGIDGVEYQVTALITTNAGRVKEVDFKLQVREL